MINEGGIISCLEAKSGNEIWESIYKEKDKESDDEKLSMYINEMKKNGCCFISGKPEFFFDDDPDKDDYHLLRAAFNKEKEELVKFFLSCGLEPKYDVWSPVMGYHERIHFLELYAERGNLEMIMYLFENKYVESSDILDSGLFYAIKEGFLAIVQYLLEKGADPAISYSTYLGEEGFSKIQSYDFSPDDATEFENNTYLYYAIINKHLDIARLLIDYGADPFKVRKEYKITYIKKEKPAEDEYFDEYDPGNYIYSATLLKEERIIDIARDSGYNDFANEIELYLAGNRLNLDALSHIRYFLKKKDYDYLEDRLMNTSESEVRYCKLDRDLYRNANYMTATHFFIKKDYRKSILFYQQTLTHGESNEKGIKTLEELKAADLSKWKHEGEQNAPCYYCLFNISCAYSQLGEIDKGFEWLSLAITMNRGLKETAKTDKDLQALREYKGRFSGLVR